MNFLQRAIVLLSPKDLFEQVSGTFPMPDEVTKLHIADTNGSDLETVPNLALERLSMESVEKQERNTLRLSMLQSVLRLLTRYIQLYASTPALVEIFEPMQTLIAQTLTVSWHDDIQVKLRENRNAGSVYNMNVGLICILTRLFYMCYFIDFTQYTTRPTCTTNQVLQRQASQNAIANATSSTHTHCTTPTQV